MKVHVNFSAQARVAAGYAERDVELSAMATVLDLLRTLADAGPPEIRSFMFRDAGDVQRTLILVRSAEPLQRRGITTVLNDGDVVSIVAPVAGG